MADIRLTPQLTDFVGPDEDPLSMDGRFGPLGFRPLQLQRFNNTATSQPHPTVIDGYIAASRWTPETFTGNVEVWACTDGGQLGAALESWRIDLWNAPLNLQGYSFLYGGGISKGYFLRYYSGGGVSNFTNLASSAGGFPDIMMMRLTPTNVEGWASFDNGANWSLMVSVADANFRTNLHMSLQVEDPTNGGLYFSCFGGGVPHRTQFFRWLHN